MAKRIIFITNQDRNYAIKNYPSIKQKNPELFANTTKEQYVKEYLKELSDIRQRKQTKNIKFFKATLVFKRLSR